MDCGKCNCGYISVIVAILAGVALGVLYALGFVATGIIFWVYLVSGILALLLAPLYTAGGPCTGCCRCISRYLTLLLVSAIGTVAATVVGLIVAAVAPVVVVAIALGVATLFTVLLLGTLVCLTRCLVRG